LVWVILYTAVGMLPIDLCLSVLIGHNENAILSCIVNNLRLLLPCIVGEKDA